MASLEVRFNCRFWTKALSDWFCVTGLDTGEPNENRPCCSRERRRARMALHTIRCRRPTKRLRTREEGKERTTRLDGVKRDRDAVVALYPRSYSVKLYLAYLYDFGRCTILRGI